MPSLNVIGCGQVGKALAGLLIQRADFRLECVLNRSLSSSIAACTFLDQGNAIADFSALTSADVYLITVPDQHIANCTQALADSGLLNTNSLVLHCSGFLSSDVLTAAQSQGAKIASLHPVKSFVDPQTSINTFAGTFCALEGDPTACEFLSAWIEKMGGVPFYIKATEKTTYHSALVIASNYLVALQETALRCLEKAGISQKLGSAILAPLMENTLQQTCQFGTAAALSGPIARGDYSVVVEELKDLGQWDKNIQDVYRSLGRIALELAKTKEKTSQEALDRILGLLT